MGTIHRNNWSRGWDPSMDAINGDPSGLLRADNLRLDEEGILSLRLGSDVLYTLTLGDTDVHSLFTTVQNGVRQRCAGVSDSVYINGAQVAVGLGGDGDISFGSYQDNIFWARSDARQKWIFTAKRNWGIDALTLKPTLSAIAPDSKTFATFNSGESPGFTAEEGSITYVKGKDDSPSGALALTPNGTSGRGTIVKKWATDQNFESYDGGDTGIDEDLLRFYLWMQDPARIAAILVMIDCNDGTFAEDYFQYEFDPARPAETKLDPARRARSDYNLTARDRQDVEGRSRRESGPVTPRRQDAGTDTAASGVGGWSKFQVARGNWDRVGSTTGKGWNTVRAVKFVVQCATGSTISSVRLDDFKILGGAAHPLTGKFAVKVVAANNNGTYVALSGPSPVSDEITLEASGLNVSISAADLAALDPQVNELWAYVMGGGLDRFYRATVSTDVSDPVTINCSVSEVTLAKNNIQLEEDNDRPPEDIIGIVGPYFERLLVLTPSLLHPSRQRNPDSFATGQAIKTGGPSETNLWLVLVNDAVCVGTSKNIYRLDGTGAELPDGIIDFTLRPLNIQPPINAMVAQDGNLLVYMASDGPRLFNGHSSEPLRGSTDLLFRGYNRHDVSAINMGADPGRMRACLAGHRLIMTAPEGSSSDSTVIMYEYDLNRKTWARLPYEAEWLTVYREPDGKILAGDNAARIWQLETTTTDEGSFIPVTVWTKSDDNGQPLNRKDAWDVRLQLDTGGRDATVQVFLDEASTAAVTTVANTTGSGIHQVPIPEALKFKRIQLKIAGAFSTFKLYDFTVQYRERPVPRLYWDTGHLDLAQSGGMHRDVSWPALLNIKADSPVNLRVRFYFGGTLRHTATVPVTANVTDVYPVRVPLNVKGRQPLIAIDANGGEESSAFELYWVKVKFRGSGTASEKPERTLVVG